MSRTETVRRIPRIDGVERVTGAAKYVGDWKVEGMLYGKPILSTIPHAQVKKIDTSRAKALPGVKAVLTSMDTDMLWIFGDKFKPRRLFTDRVRFAGDCIGAVAAENRETAEMAVDLVEAEYGELPAVFTVEEALKAEAPKIWPEGNLQRILRYSRGNVEEGLRTADRIFEDTYWTARYHNAPMEPGASLAWWEGDRLTIVASTQAITSCRDALSENLRLPKEKLRILGKYKGGGFGNKNRGLNYDLMAALLSKETGRPVMVEYGRREDFIGVHGRWSTKQSYKVGVKDGELTAIECKAYADIGSYARNPTDEYIDGPGEYYRCPNVDVETFAVYTNTAATGNMRAPSAFPGCFPFESVIDQIANDLGTDPVEFRLRNRSIKFHDEEIYTSNGLQECIRLGAERIGWKDNWNPPGSRPPEKGSKKRGIGMAIATFHSSVGPGEAILKVGNERVDVYVGVTDIGTGAKSTMAIIAAESLGIPLRAINLVWGDTDLCPYSIGESGSRTTTHTGIAVKAAAEDAKRQILERASKLMDTLIEDLDVRDGYVVSSDGNRGAPIFDLVNLGGEITVKSSSNPQLPEGHARNSFGAHFAEVDVDVETGRIEILRYVAAHDSGRIVNHLTAESQVQGGVCMGLSMALSEELLIDRSSGAISNPTLWQYHIQTHLGMPQVEVIFVETDDPFGPKSLGEVAVMPTAPAVANALYNAVKVRMKKIPMTPERVLLEIEKAYPGSKSS